MTSTTITGAQCLRRSRPACAVAIGVICAALAGAATAGKKDDPFSVPRAQIVSTVKAIGVLPLNVASVVPNAPAVAARYEPEVVRRLTAAGFQVVPPGAMRDIRDRFLQASGPLYNSMDGKPYADKIAQYEQSTGTAYDEAHPVDALLRISIDVRRADTYADVADWDGVRENITGKHGLATLFAGGSMEGTMPVLSFVVTMRDHAGQLLYHKAGGLQLLHYISSGVFTMRHRDVDPQHILTDPARDARAMQIALGPLTGDDRAAAVASAAQAPVAPIAERADAATLSREAMVAQFPRLLLVPLQMADMPQRAAVQQRLTEALQARLGAMGFTVLKADQYDSLWNAERERVGGFYDPQTGKPDAEKLEHSRAAVAASIMQGQSIQGIVYPSVAVRAAQYAQGDASWDGVKERAFIAKTALGGIFNVAKTSFGKLDAASLHVRIVGADGATLLDDYGGIQLLEKLDHGSLAATPEAELFADAGKDATAIDIALQALNPPPKR